MKIIKELPPPAKQNQYVALDTELFGMDGNILHRPTSGKFACLTACYEPGTVYLIEDEHNVQRVIDSMQDGVWLFHNAKFDLTQLRRWAKIPPRRKIVDTMLMEKILYGGYYTFFGLDALVRRYLDRHMDKSMRDKFITAQELTPELINYSVDDTSSLMEVWGEQKKHITNVDMKIWKEIDRPAMWAVLDFMGIRLDVDKWQALAELNRERQKELDTKIPFNPRSSKQVVENLRMMGFPRLKDSAKGTLIKMMSKYPDTEAARLAKLTIESRKYGKLASTYGLNFLDKFIEQEWDGVQVLHTDYRVIGAETGRMSSADPNLQNIPARETNEFRECFIARPGNKFIKIDYSAQEPRITAFLSQDKKLIKIFNSNQDAYILIAKEQFGKTITKGDPLRGRMKSTVLGMDYGMSPFGLAEKEGITVEEAEDLIGGYFKAFPSVYRWITKQEKKTKVVHTVAGRKIHLNSYSNQCPRNALNGPHQGTASDMMKKAMGIIHQEWDFDYPFAAVEVTHDELGFDVPEKLAPEVAKFATNIMEQVGNEMCPGVNFKADVMIGDSWGAKS